MLRNLLSLLVFLVAVMGASSAQAQDFEGLVAEGMKRYSEGDYDGAIGKFFEAKLLKDEPELVYNIARSYDKKGDCTAAQKHYEQFLSRSDAPAATTDKARRYLEELGVCPTKGTLALACNPPDASVQIDGLPVGPCGTYELEQGDHVIIVAAQGYVPQDKRIAITPGQVEATTVSLDIASGPSGPNDTTPSGTNWLAIGTLSAGGALIVATIVVDQVNYSGNAQELEKYPVGDPARASFEDAYASNQSLMWITGGLGVAALAAGTVFLLTDIGAGSEQAEAENDDLGLAWRLLPTTTADGGFGAWLHVAF